MQYRMLVEQPYRYSQPDVIFASSTVGREYADAPAEERAKMREAFFAKPQACLRASPLAKRYGWGIHFDAEGKAAAYPRDSGEYARLTADPNLTQTRGMRSKRA